jgi:alanine-synthesizing transaminase
MFSRRAGWSLCPNELAERAAARRSAGLPILDLTESNPTRCGLPAAGEHLRAVLAEVARDPRSAGYAPEPLGARSAREAIAAVHAAQGAAVTADDIVLTAGTSEGYAHLFRLLADPGERVLVPSPSYPLFGLLAGLESIEAEPYPLRWRGGRWEVDLAAIARAAAPPSRTLLVVHPNNPTGSLASRAEAAALRALCRAHDLALISDEVFAGYRTPSAPADAPPTFLPSLGDVEDGPLTFVLSGASKLLGLPQLKVAWIVVSGPERLRSEAIARLEVIADTFLSVSGPAQCALPSLLAAREALAGAIARRVDENRARVAASVVGIRGLTLLAADGGWAAILRLRSEQTGAAPDEDALVTALLDGPGVIVHPGWLFDLLPEDEHALPASHLVLSLLPEPQVLEAGLAHVLRAAAEALG